RAHVSHVLQTLDGDPEDLRYVVGELAELLHALAQRRLGCLAFYHLAALACHDGHGTDGAKLGRQRPGGDEKIEQRQGLILRNDRYADPGTETRGKRSVTVREPAFCEIAEPARLLLHEGLYGGLGRILEREPGPRRLEHPRSRRSVVPHRT